MTTADVICSLRIFGGRLHGVTACSESVLSCMDISVLHDAQIGEELEVSGRLVASRKLSRKLTFFGEGSQLSACPRSDVENTCRRCLGVCEISNRRIFLSAASTLRTQMST